MNNNGHQQEVSYLKELEKLVLAGATKTHEIDGIRYTLYPMHREPVRPVPEALACSTLGAVVDYLKKGAVIDRLLVEDARFLIHIVDPRTVSIVSGLFGPFEQRKTFLTADADTLFGEDFRLGVFYGLEDFVIRLQACFVDRLDLAKVLACAGNVKEETVRSTSDDGVSQTVIGKAGIVAVAEIKVPNPVFLAPWRTFREIDQPGSPFIFRMKSGGNGHLPTAALFEADGASWKLEAIARIRQFLLDAEIKVPILG